MSSLNSTTYQDSFPRGRRYSSRDHSKPCDYDYFPDESSSSFSSYSASTGSGISHTQNTKRFDQINEMLEPVNYYYDDPDTGMIDHENIHRNREALIQQLYTSENAYLQSLELIMNLFYYPLRGESHQQQQQQQQQHHQQHQSNSTSTSTSFLSGSRKPICTQRELQWLFCNLEEIYQLHKNILKAVEQRLNIFGPMQLISDILYDTIYNSLGRYYGAYLDNYHITVSTYERLSSYAPFKKFIESTHKNPLLKGATLLSLLQIPAGCVYRYAQIISRLADATFPMHPDYSGLQKMKQAILGLSEEIRPKIDNADNVDQVLMIHQALVEAPFTIHADRRLILQGDLIKLNATSKQRRSSFSMDSFKKANPVERTFILFSDILLYVQARQDTKRTVLQYKGHIQLESARVRALPKQECGKDYCVELTSSYSGVDTLNTTVVGSSRIHVLQTKSQEEQEDWVYHLSSVIAELGRSAAKVSRSRILQEQRSRSGRKSSDPRSTSNMLAR